MKCVKNQKKIKNDKQMYRIHQLPTYKFGSHEYINSPGEEYNLKDIVNVLTTTDKSYHVRILENTNYILFGDCDYYDKSFDIFADILMGFFKKYYDIEIIKSDILYTINKSKKGSFHYSIPKYHCSRKKLHEIFTNFFNMNKGEFHIAEEGKKKKHKVVDTTVYTDHWFRYPNQSKEGVKGTSHQIVYGTMKDFIINYIPKTSVCIEDKMFIVDDGGKNILDYKNKKNGKIIKKCKKINIEKKDIAKEDVIKNNNIKEDLFFANNDKTVIKQLFDECFDKSRFSDYDDWIKIGFALHNRFGADGFDLFDYYSSKSSVNYEGIEKQN